MIELLSIRAQKHLSGCSRAGVPKKAAAGLADKDGAAAAGASETEELYHVLTACMMVRRLKKDVLSQLPPKRRTQASLPLITVCPPASSQALSSPQTVMQ